jgi:hypothetical protein
MRTVCQSVYDGPMVGAIYEATEIVPFQGRMRLFCRNYVSRRKYATRNERFYEMQRSLTDEVWYRENLCSGFKSNLTQ